MILILVTFVSTVYPILVTPGENITEGNCSGQLDHYLCNCLTSNTTIDIHLSPGRHNFTKQPICLLENKTSIHITGSAVGDTIIECIQPFSIAFMSVRNVTISNITMINCGDVVNDAINKTINETIPIFYFGYGFRFAVMFYNAIDVSISEFTMLYTLGYGIVAFNMVGDVSLSKLHIENTTLENDPECADFYITYNDNRTVLSCSGGGAIFIFSDATPMSYNATTITINQSVFKGNRNFLPPKLLGILIDAVQTGLRFYKVPMIPIQGTASIAIFYLQNSYDVNMVIADTMFRNNTGTLSGTLAIASINTTRGKTFINSSDFYDNNYGESAIQSDISGIRSRGGISFYYFVVGTQSIPRTAVQSGSPIEILTVVNCNFTKIGGILGAALYIEKSYPNSPSSLTVKIENCFFLKNVADAGSAVYAVDNRFSAPASHDGIIVLLVNVSATNNTLSPGTDLRYSPSDFINGVFSVINCKLFINCLSPNCSSINLHSYFTHNEPSVIYGQSSSITLSGANLFFRNCGRFGGALRLIDSIVYIRQGSRLNFTDNYAYEYYGGAIYIFFNEINIQQQLYACPIQFIGSAAISTLSEVDNLNVSISFENNTVGNPNSLQSIYANVLYLCSWYPETSIKFGFNLASPIVNGTRLSVYHKVFKFYPSNTIHDHICTPAYILCPCDDNNSYSAKNCLTNDTYNILDIHNPIVAGQSSTINFIGLNEVGSAGCSPVSVHTKVYSYNTTSRVIDFTPAGVVELASGQTVRTISFANRTCTQVKYTIYGRGENILLPNFGIFALISIRPGFILHVRFNYSSCSIGFNLQRESKQFACVCGSFFINPQIKEDFQCNSTSGTIYRENMQSWLSVVDEGVEYIESCLPVYCNDIVRNFNLTDYNILCDNNHAGRACGGCIDGYGRVFGSNSCKRCSNAWLATILLYAILGIILVMILYLLRLTVTMGTINGLIFFCNVMSINERLFFNTEDYQFLFLRVFISLINLDLGFEMCFYNEMSQIAKTGLQFVFPVYLWLLIVTIIFIGRYYFHNRLSSYSPVPVLATLILLSYSKLLRTTVSIFSHLTIHYTTKESNFSSLQQLTTWQPDPNMEYLRGAHIALFLIAVVFMLLFIIPFALAMTFPTIVLRSKRISRLFPLLDCFYAPYKDKYHYWFGARLIVLIFLSAIEYAIFLNREALLLSGILVIIAFITMQSYIRPFKNTLVNMLDLIFMEIFVMLSVAGLYVYPNYEYVNIAVKVFGYLAFLIFCLVILYHIHYVLKYADWYIRITVFLTKKLNDIKGKWNLFPNYVHCQDYNRVPDNQQHYNHYQESILAQM